MSLLDQHSDDLDNVFYDTSKGFAQSATTSGGGSVTVIFDNPFYPADPGGNVPIDSQQPMARIRDSEATGLARGDQLTIDAIDYSIIDKQPNGEGETMLALRRV